MLAPQLSIMVWDTCGLAQLCMNCRQKNRLFFNFSTYFLSSCCWNCPISGCKVNTMFFWIWVSFLLIKIGLSTNDVQLTTTNQNHMSMIAGFTARFQCTIYRCSFDSPTVSLLIFGIIGMKLIRLRGSKMMWSFSTAQISLQLLDLNLPTLFFKERSLRNISQKVR